jgi:AraC-like DNA-binding protein
MLKGCFDQTGDIAIDLSAISAGDIKEPVRARARTPAPNLPYTVEELIVEAWDDLGRLRRIAGHAGCEVALYVTAGRTIDDRINVAPSQTAAPGKRPRQDEGEGRSRPGAIPGIGIVVDRPPRRYPPTAAPILTPDGSVIAALGLSSSAGELAGPGLDLARSVVLATAYAIEERLFRRQHSGAWIVALGSDDVAAPGMLIAVDASQRIIAANRAARKTFNIDERVGRASLWKVFETEMRPFRRNDVADLAVSLKRTATGDSWMALVTAPTSNSVPWWSLFPAAVHFRPRLEELACSHSSPAPRGASGGLSASALRRVRAYIDNHIENAVDLRTLADIAGLSLSYFARAFKKSTGMTPHAYLMGQRLLQARDLLTQSTLSLAEIAVVSGFCDQSHLTRTFRRQFGTPPLAFRRAAA